MSYHGSAHPKSNVISNDRLESLATMDLHTLNRMWFQMIGWKSWAAMDLHTPIEYDLQMIGSYLALPLEHPLALLLLARELLLKLLQSDNTNIGKVKLISHMTSVIHVTLDNWQKRACHSTCLKQLWHANCVRHICHMIQPRLAYKCVKKKFCRPNVFIWKRNQR